jgi:hypothetical protein
MGKAKQAPAAELPEENDEAAAVQDTGVAESDTEAMTDEEREALKESDEVDDEAEADEAAAEGGDAGDKADEKAEADEAEEKDDKEPADQGDEEAADKAAEDEEGADADATPEGDESTAEEAEAAAEDEEGDDLRSVMPEDYALGETDRDDLKKLEQQIADLDTKFDDGDLNATEHRAQTKAISDKALDLRMKINSAESAWQRAAGEWTNRTVKRFIKENTQYDAEKNPTLNNMLDAEVRRLQQNSTDPFAPSILRKAHNNIRKALGLDTDEKPAADKGKKDGKTPADKSKKKEPVAKDAKKPGIPPTLKDVPNDEIDDEGGEFARLDRLATKDPIAYEEALDKMSPEKREEYLQSAA